MLATSSHATRALEANAADENIFLYLACVTTLYMPHIRAGALRSLLLLPTSLYWISTINGLVKSRLSGLDNLINGSAVDRALLVANRESNLWPDIVNFAHFASLALLAPADLHSSTRWLPKRKH